MAFKKSNYFLILWSTASREGSTGHCTGSSALLHSPALFRRGARAWCPESPWQWAPLPHSLLQLGVAPSACLYHPCVHLSAVFSAFCKQSSRCTADKVSLVSQNPYGLFHRGQVSRSFLQHFPALFLVHCSAKMLT